MDFFEVFGLPRRLTIDAADLQQRFYALARRHHPDFHQGVAPEEEARVNQASARVNAAYRVLRDPIARIEYLLRLEEGQAAGGGGAVTLAAPAELLEEMFETQEALQAAKAEGLDDAGRTTLVATREDLLARYRDAEAALCGRLSEAWDHAGPEDRPAMLAAFKKALATRAYLRTVIDDLGRLLDEREAEGAHGPHRRH
jgi:molecular chaperone HscB